MRQYPKDPYIGDPDFPLCLLFDGQDQPAVFYGDVEVWMARKGKGFELSTAPLPDPLLKLRRSRGRVTLTPVGHPGIWLNCVLLRQGQAYPVAHGDMLHMEEVTDFAVYFDSVYRNGMEEVVAELKKAMEAGGLFAGKRLRSALVHVPLYAWCVFREDGGAPGKTLVTIPRDRGPGWTFEPEPSAWDPEVSTRTRELPLFTSEEEAGKAGCPLAVFLCDMPLYIFREVMARGCDVVLDPFSAHPARLDRRELEKLWKEILWLNAPPRRRDPELVWRKR